MVTRRTLLGLGLAAGGAAVAGAGATAWSYSAAMDAARGRIASLPSSLAPSRYGDIEYADTGSGPAILMLHGTGGGFDQGLLFARPLIEAGYRVIAPSRFGYLRSAAPEEASVAMQADAYVDLLDHLGVEKVAVIGGSAGARSTLQFGIRHADRCVALCPVVPQTYYPGIEELAPWSPMQQRLALAVLESDFLFWTALTLAPDQIVSSLLATDPAVLHAAPAGEQARVRELMWGLLPISDRAAGLIVDARHAASQEIMALSEITAPTLAVSAEDDKYRTAESARYIDANTPGARLIVYPDGGHVWAGRQDAMFGAIRAFLKEVGHA